MGRREGSYFSFSLSTMESVQSNFHYKMKAVSISGLIINEEASSEEQEKEGLI
ncbi:hypothetical protein [Niallia circulans]|uniref:hypothetical protein n=1 Tax=Niallia circulans TaxID=1397 RepID=UPI0026F1BAB8|nr:hypothetical protein [Niallia circulans]